MVHRSELSSLDGPLQIVAADRKRPTKEKELVQKYKVFAKLQTAQDFEVFTEGLLCSSLSLSDRSLPAPGTSR